MRLQCVTFVDDVVESDNDSYAGTATAVRALYADRLYIFRLQPRCDSFVRRGLRSSADEVTA